LAPLCFRCRWSAWRFDITAVALAVGGVALIVAGDLGRPGCSWPPGTLVKIYPAVLVPVLIAWLVFRDDRRGALRLVAAFGLTGIVIGAMVVAIVGVEPALSFVSYQDARLVQVESVASSAAMALHLLAGLPVTLSYGFQSLQITAPGLDLLLQLEAVLLIVGVGGVSTMAALRFRSERRLYGAPELATLFAYLVAVVIALLVANKVSLPQYLLWMLPFGLPPAASPDGRRRRDGRPCRSSCSRSPTTTWWRSSRPRSRCSWRATCCCWRCSGGWLVRYRPLPDREPAAYGAAFAVSERTS